MSAKRKYLSATEMWSQIQTNPERVEFISYLPSGRCNVKLSGDESAFFCSRLDDKGKEKIKELGTVLVTHKCSFTVLDKVRGKKIVFKDGNKVSETDFVTVEAGSPIEVSAGELAVPEAPPIPEGLLKDGGTLKLESEAKAEPEKPTHFEFGGLKFPIVDVEALVRSAAKAPLVDGDAEEAKVEEAMQLHEARVLDTVCLARSYVPEESGYVPVPEVKMVLACVKSGLPVYLEAHTGVGKTEMIKWFAAKTGNPLLVIQASEDLETSDLIGHIEINSDGTYYVEGLVTKAVRLGWWLYIDEVNALPPGVKICLHGLLDDNKFIVLANHEGERVRAHPNFRFFAAGNPVDAGLYSGIGDENLAFLNRFQRILLDYLPPRIEKAVLADFCRGRVKTDHIGKLVDVAGMTRKLFKEGRLSGVLSTRDLKQMVANWTFLTIDEAVSMAIGKFPKPDRQAVLDSFEQHFGVMTGAREIPKR